MFNSRPIFFGGIIIGVFGLISRLVGLLRDRVLASRFGASDILDAYYVSFSIPDLIFNLIVVGAISAAFIPVFIDYYSKNKESAWKLANDFLNIMLFAVLVVVVVLFFFVPGIINLIAPGFTQEKKDLAVLFTRVMLLSPVIFTVSMVMGSILQSFNKFFYFSLAPVFYNIGIIIGAVYLEPLFGPLGLAEGVILGAFLHLTVQYPAAVKSGFRWRLVLDFASSGMRKIFYLMAPRTIGLAASQLNWIVLNAIATTVSVGSVAIFNFANNLQYVPVSLIGISIAVASFPTLSRMALKEDRKEFIGQISKTIFRILFIIIPFSFLLVYLRENFTWVILGAGKFQAGDVRLTADILGIFTIGIFAQTLIPFLSRSFYAMQNTVIPVLSAVIAVTVNISLALYLINQGILSQPILALPLAFSFAGILNLTLLLFFLKNKLVDFKLGRVLGYFAKIILISGIMIALVSFVNKNFAYQLWAPTFWGNLIHGLTLSFAGVLIYIFLSYILNKMGRFQNFLVK